MLALLELLLQRGGTRTAQELATTLGVDERTVRRYIEHLIELDVPVETGFTPPADADPVREVLASLAATPRDYAVRVLIGASEAHVRRRLPPSIATVVPAEEEGWVRVSLEAARLGWVAGVLAQLDAPFHIEQPEPLRREVAALAARLGERALADRWPD